MSSYISEIQTKLKNAGYYTGVVDGIAGKLTVEAVTKALAAGKAEAKDVIMVQTLNKSDPALVEPTYRGVATKGFVFPESSKKRLNEVNYDLWRVTNLALKYSKQNFAVTEGLRTVERQKQLVKSGASQTMKSKHIDGMAVDLAPVVNGKISWDWQYFYPIAEAMRKAAKELNVRIRWGGAWVVLNDTTKPATELVKDYVAERKRLGKKAFTDGPHFELM